MKIALASVIVLLVAGGVAALVWTGAAGRLVGFVEERIAPSGGEAPESAQVGNSDDEEAPAIYYDESDRTPRFITGRFSDRTVTNADEAIDSLGDVKDLMRMGKPADEFVAVAEDEYRGGRHYRLQQVCNGVEVYSKQLVVSVDAEGATTALSGDYDPDLSIDVDPALSEEDAFEKLAEIEDAAGALSEGLVIFPSDKGGHELAWKFSTPETRFFISAQSGALLCTRSLVSYETVEGRGKDNDDVEQTFNTQIVYGGAYELVDATRNLYVYDAENETLKMDRYFQDGRHVRVAEGVEKRDENGQMRIAYIWLATGEEAFWESRGNGRYALTTKDGSLLGNDLVFGDLLYTDSHPKGLETVSNDSRDWGNPTAITALTRVSSVYDWYKQTFLRSGYDGEQGATSIYVNDNKAGDSTNAYSSGGLIAFGSKNDISSDTACHEITHSVEGAICSLDGYAEAGALKEAYSDIMACLFTRDATWMYSSSRNLAEPENSKTPSEVGGAYWLTGVNEKAEDSETEADNDTYVHTNCTVVGHAAYLMNQKGISMDNLEQIWYNSMFYLSPTADFITCRSAVLASAIALGFDKATQDIISDSFDEVNIGGSRNLAVVAPDATVEVLDSLDQPAKGVRMKVASLANSDPVVEVEIPEGSCKLDDVPGIVAGEGYTLTFADPSDTAVDPVSVRVFVREKGVEKLVVQTSFGIFSQGSAPSKAPVSKADCDVALVLDVSGSMSGDPIEQTKKAANSFVSTSFDNVTRIGLVTYSSEAEVKSEFTDNQRLLGGTINGLKADGGTNIEDGLKKARTLLAAGSADKKIIVLMTDGQPTDGKGGEDLVAYADEIKNEGVTVFTVGFFESMSGGISDAQKLLEGIASEGFHYEVSKASDLDGFFGDIADQINGTRFVYARVACPVDVRVEFEGGVLDSSGDSPSTRADFGTLTFEEAEDESARSSNDAGERDERVKVLRLKEGPAYDVVITGTGEGVMNYTVGFVDDSGTYDDFREFEDIPITETTRVETVAENAEVTTVRVDADGDGSFDKVYEARANEKGAPVDRTWMAYAVVAGCGLVLVGIVGLYVWIRVRRKRKRARTHERRADQ